MSCAVDDCERPEECKGWCSMHYKRWRRTGSPLGRAGVQPIERFSRFWQPDEASGCWLWTGGLDTDGYGIFSIRGRNIGAHRWSYGYHCGEVPTGLVLDHLCRVRRCVNPAHLEPVTNRENILRGEGLAAINAAKTHCMRGHPFNEINTGRYGNHRYCRECVAA